MINKNILGKEFRKQILLDIEQNLMQVSYKPVIVDFVFKNDIVGNKYASLKQSLATELGFDFTIISLNDDLDEEELISYMKHEISYFQDIAGIMMQLPLPEKYNTVNVLEVIPSHLDIDCITSQNYQAMVSDINSVKFLPPTALAVVEIIKHYVSDYVDKNIAIIGQGYLVGYPVLQILQHMRCKYIKTITLQQGDIKTDLQDADIIISAAGVPGLVQGDLIKNNCLIIDAGSSENNGSMVGDVDYNSVIDKVSYITPVPGGLGPITVAMLLLNASKNIHII